LIKKQVRVLLKKFHYEIKKKMKMEEERDESGKKKKRGLN